MGEAPEERSKHGRDRTDEDEGTRGAREGEGLKGDFGTWGDGSGRSLWSHGLHQFYGR
jgi:hypothetical protein